MYNYKIRKYLFNLLFSFQFMMFLKFIETLNKTPKKKGDANARKTNK